MKYKGIEGGIKTFYTFTGSSGIDNSIFLYIIMPDVNDTLKITTYHLIQGSPCFISINQAPYAFIDASDYLDVTITNYSNGIVDGNFSGKLLCAFTHINTHMMEKHTTIYTFILILINIHISTFTSCLLA